MSFSNSFDAEFLPPQSVSSAHWSADALPPVRSVSPETTEASPYLHWQEHLLPLSCVAQEDNLTVLRVELETAHQLLQYQQAAIDALREQMVNRDLHLQHAQDEQAATQQICDRQAAQLAELESICRDLKVQLRRQQQRVLQYRNVLKAESSTQPVSLPQETSGSVMSFGYAISVKTCSTASQTATGPARTAKPLPVSTWSAPGSIDLTGPLACYRKLATIRMTTASVRIETRPHPTLVAESEPTRAKPLPSAATSAHRVELPSFTRSVSH